MSKKILVLTLLSSAICFSAIARCPCRDKPKDEQIIARCPCQDRPKTDTPEKPKAERNNSRNIV